MNNNDADGNKSGPHRAQRSSAAAPPSPVFHRPSSCFLYFLARLLTLTSGCQLALRNRRGLIEGWCKHGRGRHLHRGTFPLNFSWLDIEARVSNKTALYRIRVRYEKSSSLGDKVCPPLSISAKCTDLSMVKHHSKAKSLKIFFEKKKNYIEIEYVKGYC